jgi:hypothetical protein
MTKAEWKAVAPALKEYHRAVETFVSYSARVSPAVRVKLQQNMKRTWAKVLPWVPKITADMGKRREPIRD